MNHVMDLRVRYYSRYSPNVHYLARILICFNKYTYHGIVVMLKKNNRDVPSPVSKMCQRRIDPKLFKAIASKP